MLSFEQAQEAILESVQVLSSETVSIHEAAGRVLSRQIVSPTDLPPFDNSAMDGYAVRGEDLRAASDARPVRLKMIAKIGAGDWFEGGLTPGACVRIFTGSPIPGGADAIAMQEDVTVEGPETILFREPVKPLEHFRLRGEDVRHGTVLAAAGQTIGPSLVALLAACGIHHLEVARRPKASLLATGSELCEPGETLSGGRIFESNRIMLQPLAAAVGAETIVLPLVQDDPEKIQGALRKAFEHSDLVISTGGVSVGEFDFVKEAIQSIGGTVDFWKVAIKPGKPFVFGQVQGKLFFGLPGNPVSALVTFLLLVRPAILKLQGAAEVGLPQARGELVERIVNRGDRRHFVRVKLSSTGKITVAGPQASHRLGTLGSANALVDMPAESTLEPGEIVPVLLWDWPRS